MHFGLRVPASLLLAWQNSGPDWRARLEALMEAHRPDGPQPVPAAPIRPTPAKAAAAQTARTWDPTRGGVRPELDTSMVPVMDAEARRAAYLERSGHIPPPSPRKRRK